MKITLQRSLLSFTLLGLVAACDSSSSSGSSSVEASQQDPDAAIAWFDLLYDSIATEGLSPPVASRIIGYASVAAYEAVVPGMPDHRSLVGQLNDFDTVPAVVPGRHHWPSVLNAAVASTLEGLFAGASAPTLQAIADLEASLAADAALDNSTVVLDRSTAHGEAIAAAVLDWSLGDGYDIWNNCAYTPPTGAGMWEPTPPAMAPALQPCWGKLRPFVLLFGAECSTLAPPFFSEDPGSAFHTEALEVYDVVNALTQPQMDIAEFWADNPVQTGTPPGHWISIVGQVAVQHDKTLADVAEAYAHVGLAVADAFISCWDMKFYYNLMRPLTYVNSPTGLNDPAWTTPIGTPPFPEYTSGHSVQSGAAAQVLDDLWGDLPFDDNTHDGLWPMRSFTSFFEAADEAAISRLYGGIHYRAAIERGVEQGRCIGQTILTQVDFRQ
ncbi:MAG: vanadium-dependent haloperoxidase [Planctomycetota bacterium]